MIEQCYYRVSVKGLVLDEQGRFLLIKEENGLWELPGGGLDHGEDPVDGLKREIYEEMGLSVTYVSPSPKYFITSNHQSGKTYAANPIYEIKLQNLDFKPSDECQEIKFFTAEEAKGLKLFPNVTKFIEVYNPSLHS